MVLVINDNPYGLMFALRYIFEGKLHRQCMKNIVHQHKYIHCGLVMDDDSNKATMVSSTYEWILRRRVDEFAMNTINSRSVFGSHVLNTTSDYDDSKGNVILLDKTKNIHVTT